MFSLSVVFPTTTVTRNTMDLGGAAVGLNAGNVDLMSWYMEIPVVSRMYLTGAFLMTSLCAFDVISPFSLYYNWELVFAQGQIWRLFTSYLFFGLFSVDFLFHMYFLVRGVCSRSFASAKDCRNR